MGLTRRIRLLAIPLLALAMTGYAQSNKVTFEDAKKTLTHAMLEYTIWPNEAQIDTFIIGLYGDDRELEGVLTDYMAEWTVRDKPIAVTTFQSLESAKAAHVLLLGTSRSDSLVEITAALQDSHTLVVTDGVDDDANIMVNFIYPSPRRVAFEVNAGNIMAAGLTPTRDILLFGGDKNDLADAYAQAEARLQQAEAVAAGQQQQLDQLQQRLEDQQRLLEEQRALAEQGSDSGAQAAEMAASQQRLAELEQQLGRVREQLSTSEDRLDQTVAELAEKDQSLAARDAQLESYVQQLQRSQQQLESAEEAARAALDQAPTGVTAPAAAATEPGATGPASGEQRPAPGNQAVGLAGNTTLVLAAGGALLLLVLVLSGMLVMAYRGKRRLAQQLEATGAPRNLIAEKLLQVAEDGSRSVLASAEVLEQTRLSKYQGEKLEQIIESAERVLEVSRDVDDLSRLDAGQLELENVPFTLRDVLGDILQSLALEANDKGLELTFHIPPEIPDTLIGDPQRLLQVMDNLVSNAIEFTETGEVAVDLQLESATEESVRVRFEVRDTGIGIAAEEQDKVFEPFTRPDTTEPKASGGVGLGLAISDRLAQQMGSRLSLLSTPGEGSTFYFSAQFQLPDGPVQTSRKPIKVLVVDDNSTNLMILEELLESWGIAVTVADGGEAALEALSRAEDAGESFAIALVDVKMPTMNGFELAERIRERPGHGAMRILMQASPGQSDDDALLARLDICGVVHKPIKHSELQGAITDALGVGAESAGRSEAGKLQLVGSIAANREVGRAIFGKSADKEKTESEASESALAAEGSDAQADAEDGPPPPPDNLPCLDWEGALRNLDGDKEFLAELAGTFIAQYPELLAAMENAVLKEDGNELRNAANALKASAQLAGGVAVAESAMRLESLGHMEKFADAQQDIAILSAKLDALKAALLAALSGPDSTSGQSDHSAANP